MVAVVVVVLENRPLIRAQAFGQSLNPDKLSRLARYEVHLDRKLERPLAILLRLQTYGGRRADSDPFRKMSGPVFPTILYRRP